jgi:outer membrane immunogenic protein
MKLRSILLASLGMTLATCAVAADLPMRTAAPAPPPVITPWSWAGLYLGAYAGGSFGTAKTSDVTVPSVRIGSPSLSSFTGGGLVGYNAQFSAFVLGAEGEFGYDARRGSSTYSTNTRTAEFDGTYIGRIRARAGYAWGNILFYAAGGVSFANEDLKNTNIPGNFSLSVNHSFTGWNVGLGGEYAFTPNWIARVEYIYDGFGKQTYNFGSPAPRTFDTKQVTLSENTIRAAIEYKFW